MCVYSFYTLGLTLSSAEPQQSWKACAELGAPEAPAHQSSGLGRQQLSRCSMLLRSLGQSLSLSQRHFGVRCLLLAHLIHTSLG